MAASDYTFDPSGVAPENLVENEAHTLTDRGIFPLANAFFRDGLEVEGYSNSTWTPLEANKHYTFSPLYVEMAAATGKEIFTYLVFSGEMATYSRVRLKYQAVGQYYDRSLLNHVASTSFDRNSISAWLNIKNIFTAPISVRDHEFHNKQIMEVINGQLANISAALTNLSSGGTSNFLERLQDLDQRLQQLEP